MERLLFRTARIALAFTANDNFPARPFTRRGPVTFVADEPSALAARYM